MKTPFLEEKYCLEREFYPDGTLKTERYMVHMAYIVFRYAENGSRKKVIVNGIEYPANTEFRFNGKDLEIVAGA